MHLSLRAGKELQLLDSCDGPCVHCRQGCQGCWNCLFSSESLSFRQPNRDLCSLHPPAPSCSLCARLSSAMQPLPRVSHPQSPFVLQLFVISLDYPRKVQWLYPRCCWCEEGGRSQLTHCRCGRKPSRWNGREALNSSRNPGRGHSHSFHPPVGLVRTLC